MGNLRLKCGNFWRKCAYAALMLCSCTHKMRKSLYINKEENIHRFPLRTFRKRERERIKERERGNECTTNNR